MNPIPLADAPGVWWSEVGPGKAAQGQPFCGKLHRSGDGGLSPMNILYRPGLWALTAVAFVLAAPAHATVKGGIIPTCADQHAFAQSRLPMDMIFHG